MISIYTYIIFILTNLSHNVLLQGAMAQLSVPKRFQKQFCPLLKEGHVYMFTDVAAVDIKNKTYIYHHQNYMLQFKHSTKVHRLETRGANIPNFSFKFCPFDKLPEMDIMARPLQGNICFPFFL
jgi:replication factor A1